VRICSSCINNPALNDKSALLLLFASLPSMFVLHGIACRYNVLVKSAIKQKYMITDAAINVRLLSEFNPTNVSGAFGSVAAGAKD
jgi:hypothetical protein